MKKLFAIILITISTVSSAQTVEQLLSEGNQYYSNENFSAAIDSYKKILDQGFVSSNLYYNLGNSYFRTGNLGFAVLYYEKGLKLAPGDEDLLYNLSIVNARTIDQIKEVPKLFILQWWESFITIISINGWAVLVSIFFIALLLSLAIYFTAKTGRAQRAGFMFGSINLAILVFITIVFVSLIRREQSTEFGVLIQKEITAKQSPDSKSSDVFVIHEGIKFSVEDNVNDWSKIRLSDGKVGWLPNYAFGVI